MLDHRRISFAVATFALTAPLPLAVADEPEPADETPIVETDPLAVAAAGMTSLDGFEVVVSTIVRDAEGRRLTPPNRGRVVFERTGDRIRFLAETWGGLGSARLACDGESVTLGDPAERAFETRPLPADPGRLLDDPEITARFGPAAVHLLGVVLDDGLTAFRRIGEVRTVDLGPRRAMVVPCRSMLDATDGEVRMAFAADGPPLPLAVAVLLPDGGVVELEFHDWAIGPIEDADLQFASPPGDWRPVAALSRPACLPAVEKTGTGIETDHPATAVAEVDPLAD